MKKKAILLSLIILLYILAVGCKKDITLVSEKHIGKTLVTFDGDKITSGDLVSYKKYKNSALSDEQALEMMIVNELLYKEAQAQGLTATLKEAKAESDKQRSMYEQYSTEQDKKEIQDIIKELDISEKEYWNDYCPKVYGKQITIAWMKKSIEDKIYQEIIQNHSDWNRQKLKRGLKNPTEKQSTI